MINILHLKSGDMVADLVNDEVKTNLRREGWSLNARHQLYSLPYRCTILACFLMSLTNEE